ncbi:hypothetical protein FUAX_01130 [Fulvitalea axinellae]|uniref:DUF4270 family protein n=1 Tax=Fulvitalea axinellae TaxID=1182444 RepID=A0AAU9CFY8_9BACT|nr:hypothetical protein FUAX_01130 [Fulvitalea axinellae]
MRLQGKIFGAVGGLMLALAFFLSSCETSDELTLSLGDEDPTIGLKFKEVPVKTTLVLYDSVETDRLSTWLIGEFQDNNIGKIGGEVFTMVRKNTDSLKTHDTYSPTADSLVLRLILNGYAFGDQIGSAQSVTVNELGEILKYKDYYSKDTSPKAGFLGEGEFTPRKSSKDTVYHDTLFVKLDNSLRDRLFEKVDYFADTINKQKEFNEFFHGLTISPQNMDAVFGFGVGNASLRLHYHLHPDTAYVIRYSLSAIGDYNEDKENISAETGNYTLGYSHYSYDRSGSPLANVIWNETAPGVSESEGLPSGKIYTQSAFGLRLAFDFEESVKSLDKEIVINNADIRFPVERTLGNVLPPSGLYFDFVNDKNKVLYATNDDGDTLVNQSNGRPLVYGLQKEPFNPSGLGQDFAATFDRNYLIYQAPSSSPKNTGVPLSFYLRTLHRTYNGTATPDSELKNDDGVIYKKMVIAPIGDQTTMNYFIGSEEDLMLRVYYTEELTETGESD